MRLPKTHALANDRPQDIIDLPIINDYDRGHAQDGDTFLANEASFTEETYSEALTTYGIGFKDPENNQALVEYIAPPVEVGPLVEIKKYSNAEEYLTESDDVPRDGRRVQAGRLLRHLAVDRYPEQGPRPPL